MCFWFYCSRYLNYRPASFRVGFQLGHVLALAALFVVLLLIISALWNYCAGTDSIPTEQQTTQGSEKRAIIAGELRPGLILIQGSPTSEETLRIIQEYDSMKNRHTLRHVTSGNQDPGNDSLYAGRRVPQGGELARLSGLVSPDSPDEGLIIFDSSDRPPPYAPRQNDK